MITYLLGLLLVGATGIICGYWVGRDLEARSAYEQMMRLRRAQELQRRSERQ